MNLSENDKMNDLTEKMELDDEELKKIIGGFGNLNGYTMMICQECKYAKPMPGNHKGEKKDCPSCKKKNTFVGKIYLG